jgi:hypothetical protein
VCQLLAFGAVATARASVTVTDYSDPSEELQWGTRSHWKQPWRSYLETIPASTLRNAVGINFNVGAKRADATARLLAASGFHRARIEVGWNTIDFEDPGRMSAASRESLEKTIGALKRYGLRPLILLNANHGAPCPLEPANVELTEAAPAGSTEVQVDPTDREEIEAGRTGITVNGVAAGALFTSVDSDGAAQLSRPLPTSVPAGAANAVTLLYEPFASPKLEDGSPNPVFEETMAGWLNYVRVVTREVKVLLGSEQFDVEIWNELGFGSRFLDIDNYYQPALEPGAEGAIAQIRDRTIHFLRDAPNEMPGIGIGNGFSNQSPWASGSTSTPGLTAIDKHPYHGWDSLPFSAQVNGNRPLDGLGEPAGIRDPLGQWHELFTPTYDSFFPEYFLSGIQTETLVHDLSPHPTLIGGTEHGRNTHPPGSPPPEIWLTETNLNPAQGPTRFELTPADVRHIASKDTLRYLVAFVNKGVTALDFYGADAGNLSLIDSSFFEALKANPTAYPGEAAGGETMRAVRRLVEAMGSGDPLGPPRQISLDALTDYSENVQFMGNGTNAYPPLYNRDVFAFLPFQANARRFVVPVYVMTRNVARNYRPLAPATDPTRFDMPPERYRMAIGGVDGVGARVSATDPLTGTAIPVQVVSGTEEGLVVEMDVTDSPRLLTIQEAGPPPPGAGPPPGPEPEPGPVPASGSGAKVPRPPRATDDGGGVLGRPLMRIRSHAFRGLLIKRRMSVVVRCEGRCDPRATGLLNVGRRRFAIKPVWTRIGLLGDRATIRLAISARAARAARRARLAGRPVQALITASARTGDPAATSKRSLFLRPS